MQFATQRAFCTVLGVANPLRHIYLTAFVGHHKIFPDHIKPGDIVSLGIEALSLWGGFTQILEVSKDVTWCRWQTFCKKADDG